MSRTHISRKYLEKRTPDVRWVARLAHTSLQNAKAYISEAANDYELANHLDEELSRGGRASYVQISSPFELYALTRVLKPKHVVEIGVSAGVSSAYFLRALERNENGKLHSIDLPEQETERQISSNRQISWALPPGKSSGWAVPNYLRSRWNLLIGSSGKVLPHLINDLDCIGIFLYDIPYTMKSAIADFEISDTKLEKGSVVLADNALGPIRWWARRRNERVYRRKGFGLRGFAIQ